MATRDQVKTNCATLVWWLSAWAWMPKTFKRLLTSTAKATTWVNQEYLHASSAKAQRKWGRSRRSARLARVPDFCRSTSLKVCLTWSVVSLLFIWSVACVMWCRSMLELKLHLHPRSQSQLTLLKRVSKWCARLRWATYLFLFLKSNLLSKLS